jgi:hypothetical protein
MAVVFKTNDDAVAFKVPQASAKACIESAKSVSISDKIHDEMTQRRSQHGDLHVM